MVREGNFLGDFHVMERIKKEDIFLIQIFVNTKECSLTQKKATEKFQNDHTFLSFSLIFSFSLILSFSHVQYLPQE